MVTCEKKQGENRLSNQHFPSKNSHQPEPGNFKPHKWSNLSTQDDFETVLGDRWDNADHDKDVPGICSAPKQTENIKC